MNSNLLGLAVLLAATTVAAAQASPAQNQPPAAGSTQTQTTTPASKPAGGKHMMQAKSQEELKAWQDAFAKTDPAPLEAAADAFAAKYPNSELTGTLYVKAMNLYGQANNSDKLVELGRKAIAADPTNPVPLVQVASVLAEGTHETDLDRDQRLAEASKDAHAAIDNVDNLNAPPNASPEKIAGVKASIQTMAYDSLGMVDMDKKDYPAAEQDLMKAAAVSKDQPEAVIYLRLSVAQDQLKKYPEALQSANKAVDLSPPGSAALNLAKQQQSRLQKLTASTAAPASGATASPATGSSATAPTTSTPAAPATSTPH
jgi:tetratricopeptide (TPR) repeat protein